MNTKSKNRTFWGNFKLFSLILKLKTIQKIISWFCIYILKYFLKSLILIAKILVKIVNFLMVL